MVDLLLIAVMAVTPRPGRAEEAQGSAAAPQSVTLKIMAKGSGRPLGRVEVQVGEQVLYSSPDGTVAVSIPPGEGKVLLSRFGYERQLLDYDSLREGGVHEIYLFPGAPDDNEVIIRGERRPEPSRKTITVEETARLAPEGDPAQITRILPGVHTGAFGTDVVIRGSAPEDSAYYIDFIAVPAIFHRLGGISVMPEQLIDRVQFSAGGFDARYGEATGGVIVLRTTSRVPEHPQTSFRVNVPFASALYHERPLSETSSLALSVRRSYIEWILPGVMPKEADLTVVPYYGDAHVRHLKVRDDGHVKTTLIASRDGMRLVTPGGDGTDESGRGRFDYFDEFVVFGSELRQSVGGGWSYEITPQTSYSYTTVDFLDIKFRGRVLGVRAPLELSRRLAPNRFLYLGLDPAYYRVQYDVYAPRPVSDDPFYDIEDAPRHAIDRSDDALRVAAWASVDHDLGPVLVTPGVRVFHNDQLRKTDLDPRLGWRYELGEGLVLKGAVGQYSISPQPVEASREFGNPDLDFEKSNHFILGIERRWSDRWESEVQAFHKRTYNLIVSHPSERYAATGTRVTDGLELFLRRNMTERFLGWLSYTWSTSRERPADGAAWRPSELDQTHVAHLAASYRVTPLWDVGTRIKYNTGTPYTPVVGSVYNASLDKFQPTYDRDRPNSARLPNYHSIDLFATRDSLFDTWRLAYRFGVQYLAFSKQVYGVQYNYDYSKREYFTGIPPIPYFEVRGEF